MVFTGSLNLNVENLLVSIIPPLKVNKEQIFSDNDKANCLNNYFSSVFTNERLDNIPKLESLYPDMPMFTVTVPCVFKLFFKINRSHRITSLCTFVLIIVHQIKRWTICSAVTIIVVTIFIATFQNIVSYLYRDISCAYGTIYLHGTCAMQARSIHHQSTQVSARFNHMPRMT